jgi:hypothetical protein
MPVPPEVTRVDGCSCGGLDWHLQDCTIFSVPVGRAKEAIAATHQRLRDHTEELNRQLHAELAALRGTEERP